MENKIEPLESEENLIFFIKDGVSILDKDGVHLIVNPALVLDPKHRILDANYAALSSVGLQMQDIRGKYCFEVFHNTPAPPSNCPLSKLRRSGILEESEMPVTTPKGTFLVSCTPIFDRNGALEKIIHISMDITQRKLAEETLCRNRQVLKFISRIQSEALQNSSEDAIYSTLLEGLLRLTESKYGFMGQVRFTPDNPPHLKLHAVADLSRDETRRIRYRETSPDESSSDHLNALCADAIKTLRPVIVNKSSKILREENTLQGHPPFHCFLGIPLVIDGIAVALFGVANRPKGYKEALLTIIKPLLATGATAIESIRSRKTQKETYESLLKSESLFRGVFEYAATGKSLILPNGRISRVNQTFCNMMGYDAETLIKKTFLEITHPDDVPASLELMHRLLSGEIQSESLEKRYIRSDGKTVWATVRTTLLSDHAGTPIHFIADIFDITEQKTALKIQQNLEAQLIQVQKLESVGRLAGGVAHDFNNLLSIILGYGDMILEDLADGHPHQENMREIYNAAVRAKSLTRQLLAFSRKQVLETKVLDINEAIRGFEKLLVRLLREDIVLEVTLFPDEIHIDADITQLEQVLMNLVVNARDALPNGGRLFIETDLVDLDETYAFSKNGVTPGRYAVVAVSDTGTGMNAGTLKNIFEPFFTTKDAAKGTGLGLSTVYGIVKQHNGNVWVYSEPGHGTTFKVYLPAVTEKPFPETEALQTPPPTPKAATVLVVEDDPGVRRLVCTILEKNGYRVIESDSPEHAVQLAEDPSVRIHLLLTDVIMPGMKGPEVFHLISAFQPDMKVLYMSGYSERSVSRHGVLLDGVNLLQKPISVTALLHKVATIL